MKNRVNATFGTNITDDDATSPAALATAQAMRTLAQHVSVDEVTDVDVYGGGNQQYGIGIEFITSDEASTLDEVAETVEVVGSVPPTTA